jgi:peptidoglycan/xylan/chitin deacetylase (PgdA/CDA1 family)
MPKKIKKQFSFLNILGVVLTIILAVVLFGTWQYYQSDQIKQQVDKLISKDNPEDAITLYDKAHIIFFFQRGLTASYKKAQQLLKRDLASEDKKATTVTEYQIEPSLSSLIITPIPTTIPIPQKVRVPILMYHHIRINPRPKDPIWASLYVSPTKLDEQLQYLSTHNFHTITFDDLYKALNGKSTLPKNPVLLTFDDGWRSFYSKGFPLLRKYNMQATAFIITNYPYAKDSAYFNWDQIKEMSDSGFVDFEAHTKSHPFLTKLYYASAVNEAKGSKSDLEKHIQKLTHWFAYPYGDYNNAVIKAVQEAGYLGAVTTNYGATETLTGIYTMPRIMVDGRFSIDEFSKRIESAQ